MSPPAAALAACVLFATLALGCRTPIPETASERIDAGTPLSLDDPRVRELLLRRQRQAASRNTLVATARVELDAPDRKLHRPQRLALRRPAEMRIEIMGLFSQIAAILVVDGDRYQLWSASDGRFEEGIVGPRLLWEVARVDLSPEEAIDLLLGVPAAGSARPLATAVALADGGLGLVYRDGAKGSKAASSAVFLFDASGRLSTLQQLAADGTLLWEAAYLDYRQTQSGELAHTLVIDFPHYEARARFELTSAELNRTLPDSAFQLPQAARR